MKSTKSIWKLVIILIIACIVGSYLADYISTWYKPLGYYKTIGMASPIVLDLNIFRLSFQVSVKANIGTIVGLIAGLYVNNKF